MFYIFSPNNILQNRCNYSNKSLMIESNRIILSNILSWKTPSFGIKCIFFWKHFHHSWHISCQRIFSTYFTHTGKMIDFLKKEKSSENKSLGDWFFYLPFFHLCNSFDSNTGIRPIDIPIIIIGNFTKVKSFCCTSYTFVFAHGYTNKK